MIDPTPTNLLLALCALFSLSLLHFLFLLLGTDCDLLTYYSRVSSRTFRGKVAWVTGASSGIGLALAHRLAQEGALLILSSRRSDVLEQVADSLPCRRDNVAVLPLDLAADVSAVEEVARHVAEVHGRLDYVFNNAGISTRASASDLEIEHVQKVLHVDFVTQAALARACLPSLREAPGGPGTIVNTVSVAAFLYTPLRSSYSAAKSALASYFACLELEEPRIRVVNVYPGSVRTPICNNAIAKGGKLYGRTDPNIEMGLEPERVADRMLAAVSAGLPNAWIARPKELNCARVAQAFPKLWRSISFRLADSYRRTMEEAPEIKDEDKEA